MSVPSAVSCSLPPVPRPLPPAPCPLLTASCLLPPAARLLPTRRRRLTRELVGEAPAARGREVAASSRAAGTLSPLIGPPHGILERPRPSPILFAHPSEREFARILDFFRIAWEYEPRSFVLRAKDDQILEMFSPDFYLPELDLYIELTTLRQRLVTKKNRKLRLLRELYPDVKITLLYKHDYHELLAKYGFGPTELDSPEAEALRGEAEHILFSQAQIARTVRRLGAELTRDYAGRPPILIGVLKGVAFFLADLIRAIELPAAMDFMAVSSYGGQEGEVRIIKDLDLDIQGRDVVLVEDIVDTGMTLNYLLRHLADRRPASLEVCTLLDKRARRLIDVPIRYVGFELRDEFAVGYGLDYRQRYRNLPFLAQLRRELYLPT